MWDRVGLIRNEAGLQAALATLEDLAPRLDGVGVPGGSEYNLAWQAWLDTRSQLLAARLIARSALERRESRGAHYRADYPQPDDAKWLVNVFAADRGGELSVRSEPVQLTRARPEAAPPAMVEIGD
jgi:fumarate reductase flavoprotein subunit